MRGRKDTRAHAPPGSRLHDLRRLQLDDYQSSGGSATNVFNCAKVHQNIDQVATPPPRRHAGQPSNPPSFLPSGYQSHSMTRTRHPQMTVRFENCSDPVTDQGGSAQIRIGRSPDLCYPWGSPLLHRFFSTTEHTEAASRHTEDTEPQPPAPLFPLSRFLQGNQDSSKPGQGRLDAFQCAWAVSPAARASHGNADLDGQVMEFDRQVMGKNRECVRFCFIVFCFITVPEVTEIGLRRIRRGPQLPNASRHAPRRLSRLLRSEISSRGGTAPRDGVWEHVRGVLPGRRRRAPRVARVLRAPIQLGRRAPGPFGRHAPTLKDNLHVSARSVLTGRRTPPLRINLVQHNGTAACIADPYCARALRRSWNLAR